MTPPTKERLTRRGRETRGRIVETAAKLIFDKGIDHTTIDDVRTAANVSSSQLYHYFDDKTALIRAVIEYQADTIVGAQERFDLSSLGGFREWRDFIVSHERLLNCEGGCPIGSLGSQVAEAEPESRMAVAAGFKRWEHTIGDGLRKMHELGRLAPEADPDKLALATLAALQGGLLLAQIERDTRPLEAAIDAMITLFSLVAAINVIIASIAALYILHQGQPAKAVAVLISMHLAIALVTYNTLVHLAPAGQEQSASVES